MIIHDIGIVSISTNCDYDVRSMCHLRQPSKINNQLNHEPVFTKM